MALQLRSARLVKALAAAGAASLVGALVVVFAGAGPAQATNVTLNLTYTCQFPLIGSSDISVTVNADLPDSATVGVATPQFSFSADVEVPANAAEGLILVGGTTVSGTATADSTLTNGSDSLDLQVPLTIPSTPVPATAQAFTVHSTGSAPSVMLKNAGTATITVGDVDTKLTALTAAGQPTSLGTFDAPCTLDAGQNNVLATFPVNAAGGGTTTTTASDTGTTTETTTETTTPTTEQTTTETTQPTTEETTTAETTTEESLPPTLTTAPPTEVVTTGAATTTEGVALAGNSGSSSGIGGSGGSGSLPFTGVSVLGPVLAAVVLLAGGIGILLLQRRRRRAN